MAKLAANRKKSGIETIEPVERTTPTVRLKKREKLTRAERAVILKEKIFQAGAQVVGELGYQDASVARITQLAGVAQGTFYLYFETRQDLFDQLLPHASQDFLHYIGERVRGASSFMEVEERGIRAFFSYLKENPGFYRVLNESEFSAPIAHRKNMDQSAEHYIRSMKRSIGEGSLGQFSEDELKAIAYMAIASRSHFYLSCVKYGDDDHPPESLIKAYLKLVGSFIG